MDSFPTVRLVAVDLDFTTLTSQRIPHPDNVLAFARAREAGLHVIPASGRIVSSIRPFAEMLGLGPAAIACNGAHVVSEEGNELGCRLLEPSVLDQVLAYAAPRGIHVNVYTRDELLFLTKSRWADEYARRLVTLKPRFVSEPEAKSHAIIKVSMVDSAEAVQRHVREFVPCVDPALALPTESEPEYLEFMHPLSNKGNGLRTLAEHLGIPLDQTAAIGDYFNDVEMLGLAGCSAAVANAPEAVRASADMVAPSNDEGGVAWFIDWILRHRRQ